MHKVWSVHCIIISVLWTVYSIKKASAYSYKKPILLLGLFPCLMLIHLKCQFVRSNQVSQRFNRAPLAFVLALVLCWLSTFLGGSFLFFLYTRIYTLSEIIRILSWNVNCSKGNRQYWSLYYTVIHFFQSISILILIIIKFSFY